MNVQFPRASLLLVLTLGTLSLARGTRAADPPSPAAPPAPAAPTAPAAPANPTTPAAQPQPGQPRAPQPLPTMQDLHDIYQAGQYEICLQQIARVTRLTGQDAKPYDKFTLQLLRGNCLLHANDRASAIAAFQIAAKSPDPKISVPARASELVARAADPKMTYKPTGANAGGPIDIVNDVSRRKAMMAMFDDQLAENRAALEHAKSAQDLLPIIGAAPKVLDLYALELTGTGRDEQMRPEMTAIGQRARGLIDHELQTVDERIAGVARRADQVTNLGVGVGGQWWWNGGVVRRGLHSEDRRELRETIDYLDRIHESAERGLQIARQVDGNVEAWEGTLENISHVSTRAQNVLDAE